jgi:hypothetical protein
MAGLPAIVGIVTILLLVFYLLDRKMFQRGMTEIAERKSGGYTQAVTEDLGGNRGSWHDRMTQETRNMEEGE